MNALIDAHCHLTNEEEYAAAGGVQSVLAAAKAAGVKTLIVSGFDLNSSKRARDLAENNDGVFFCAGFQPEEIKKYETGEEDFTRAVEELQTLLTHKKCVAVGEIGLDYHFPDNPSKEFQREIFRRQIDLACRSGLPVVIHSRDACADTLEILKEEREKLGRGFLMHCFSYSAETAAEFAALGAYFSFGGTVTFKKAEKTARAAIAVPQERILTETDCPYLAPEPLRGKFPNTPANVAYVVKRLAALRGVDEEEFCAQVVKNAARLFPATAE
ncbi:MAG: TatD family hydrolase [Candidatus Borkfalkiaceae bacterium]|nr:TatD family hydrolase [Clostridia bacterium]MDY6223374.1 TatD family hydrolase [Christensenellaceae bacterium]